MNKNVGAIAFVILIISVIGIFSFSILGNFILVLKTEKVMSFNANNEFLNESFILVNPILIEDEIFGKAYKFDGDSMARTDKTVVSDPRKGFSVSVIAYVDDDEYHNSLGIVSSSIQKNNTGFRIKYRDFGDIDRFYVDIGETKNELFVEIPDNSCYKKWCHYAFAYNPNGKVRIYLNGEMLKEFNSVKNIQLNNKINIGNTIDINKEFFKGKITDVQIYEGVLSDKDIKEISKNIL